MLLQSDGRLPLANRSSESPSPKAHARNDERHHAGRYKASVWNEIGIAIGLLIVVVAGATLFRLVRDIDLDKVVAALHAKSIRDVADRRRLRRSPVTSR